MVRALLFEAVKQKPCFTWVEYYNNEDEGEVPKGIREVIGGNFGMLDLEYNPVRNRKVGDLITAYYGEEFMVDGKQRLNECIVGVLKGAKEWLGEDDK